MLAHMLRDLRGVMYDMLCKNRACGAMDNASDYGSEDSMFESWQARIFCLMANIK